MDVNELAKALFGKDAKSNLLNSSPGATTTVYGTAMSNSENGEVQVFISDDAVGSDFGAEPDATIVTLPTSPAVKMGDTVAVTLLGGNTVKHPYVSAVIGSGDLTQSIANEAQRIAELTGQHFWADERGIHVTEVTEEEWKDENSETYHSGINQLSNSQGQFFRDGETFLLALLGGTDERGISIYDGSGNTENNIVGSFTKTGMVIGKPSTNQVVADAFGFKVVNPEYGDVFDVGHTTESTESRTYSMITTSVRPEEAGVWTASYELNDILASGTSITMNADLVYFTGEVVDDEELVTSIGTFASNVVFDAGTAHEYSFRQGQGGSPVIPGRLNADIEYDGVKTFVCKVYDDRIDMTIDYAADGTVSYVAAVLTLPKVVIGQQAKTHAEIDYHSLKLIDFENDEYFVAQDLRDVSGNYRVEDEIHYADGFTTEFYTNYVLGTNVDILVKVNDVVSTDWSLSSDWTIVFNTAPSSGSVVKISYISNDSDLKFFTIGRRTVSGNTSPGGLSVVMGHGEAAGYSAVAQGSETQAMGDYSHAEGYLTLADDGEASHAEGVRTTAYSGGHAEGSRTTASGPGAHAEGVYTNANGSGAHAEGIGTIARNVQHVIGQWNADSLATFVIGNGTSDTARSNGLVIFSNGTMHSTGDIVLNDAVANHVYEAHSPDIDSQSSTPPSSWKRAGGLALYDNDGHLIGRFQSVWATNNAIGANIEARRIISGTEVENFLRVWVTDDGSKTYGVASPANFRSAIGLGTDIEWTHLAGPAESSLPSGTSDRNGVWYRRKHNMVEVQLVSGGTWSNGKTWNTTAQTIATLPSGCRPGIPIHDTGNVPGANTVGQVIVSTDGTIQIQLGTGSSKYFRAHFMFTV